MPSMITLERKEQLMAVVASAARKATNEAVNELAESGVLHGDNFQQVLAQGDKVAIVVKAAIKTMIAELANNIFGRLKRLFTDRTIELAETDGEETIAEASNVFKDGIYDAVQREVCKETPKTPIAIYQIIKDDKFAYILGSFGENLKRLCLTESQIVAFCRDYHYLLPKDGYGTFFLFEGEEGGFFVAGVDMYYNNHLSVVIGRLADNDISLPLSQNLLVIPQL